jgi:hypothetical protein
MEDDDIIQSDDGFWIFWPTSNKGAYSAADLRRIAEYLDKKNFPVQDALDKFMSRS